MKTTSLCSTLLLLLPAGCALQEPSQPPWGITPVVSVRHAAENGRAYYELGRYYQGQRRLEQAEAAFLRAIELDAELPDAYNALGALYAERGELEHAVEMFRRVTAMAPDTAYLHNNLGFALLMQGRHDEAYAEIRRALALDPGFARAWDNLARIAAARSDPMLAEQARLRQLEDISGPGALRMEREFPGRPVLFPVKPGAPIVSMELADEPAPQRLVAGKIRYPVAIEQVSVTREVKAENGRVELTAAPSATPLPPPRQDDARAFRLELSNGNGINGFAFRFRDRLQAEGIAVHRITNQKPYTVMATTVEYQPGYAEAARALATRTGVPGKVVEARQPRPGSDIRVLFGKDAAIGSGKLAVAPDTPKG